MKKIINLLASLLVFVTSFAQIPYFGTTTGDKKVYTYYQVKHTFDDNTQSFYVANSIGLTEHLDLCSYFNQGDNTISTGLKFGFYKNPHFNIALQVNPAFYLKDDFKYSYLYSGLFMSGYITDKLSYISNTWYSQYKDENYFDQWLYLGYDIKRVSLLVGTVSDLKSKFKTDLATGLWFACKSNVYVYLWAGNLTHNLGNQKLTLGVDYKF